MCAQSASPVGVDVPMSMSASLTLPSAESATEPGLQHSVRTPKIVGVGTAVAGESYSQRDLLEMFRITDSRIRSVFLNSAIERRYLSLPPAGADGVRADETQKDLLAKHKAWARDMGARAIEASLANAGVQIDDIGHLCCVTTTGFLTPGLSALLIHQMGIAPRCSRVDVVGMGCHAALDALGAMRYDWDNSQSKFSFYLDPDIPYVVGAHAELVVGRLLAGTGLRRSDISHWIVHSGGKKVIDAIRVNLGLTRHDVRHTIGVMRDYGNLSSGSFLFSYERMLREGAAEPGDYGVLMTMGPGSTIETALVQW